MIIHWDVLVFLVIITVAVSATMQCRYSSDLTPNPRSSFCLFLSLLPVAAKTLHPTLFCNDRTSVRRAYRRSQTSCSRGHLITALCVEAEPN